MTERQLPPQAAAENQPQLQEVTPRKKAEAAIPYKEEHPWHEVLWMMVCDVVADRGMEWSDSQYVHARQMVRHTTMQGRSDLPIDSVASYDLVTREIRVARLSEYLGLLQKFSMLHEMGHAALDIALQADTLLMDEGKSIASERESIATPLTFVHTVALLVGAVQVAAIFGLPALEALTEIEVPLCLYEASRWKEPVVIGVFCFVAYSLLPTEVDASKRALQHFGSLSNEDMKRSLRKDE